MRGAGLVMIAIIGVLGIFTPAKADIIYTYAGNDFTTFNMGSPYTTSDSVTITLDYAEPLDANGIGTTGSPLSWSASDGVQTITSSMPGVSLLFVAPNLDGNGVPIDWLFIALMATEFAGEFDEILSNGPGGTIFGPYIDQGQVYVHPLQADPFTGSVSDGPGTWVVATTVPEPGSLALIASALTGLVFLRRRPIRHSRTQHPTILVQFDPGPSRASEGGGFSYVANAAFHTADAVLSLRRNARRSN